MNKEAIFNLKPTMSEEEFQAKLAKYKANITEKEEAKNVICDQLDALAKLPLGRKVLELAEDDLKFNFKDLSKREATGTYFQGSLFKRSSIALDENIFSYESMQSNSENQTQMLTTLAHELRHSAQRKQGRINGTFKRGIAGTDDYALGMMCEVETKLFDGIFHAQLNDENELGEIYKGCEKTAEEKYAHLTDWAQLEEIAKTNPEIEQALSAGSRTTKDFNDAKKMLIDKEARTEYVKKEMSGEEFEEWRSAYQNQVKSNKGWRNNTRDQELALKYAKEFRDAMDINMSPKDILSMKNWDLRYISGSFLKDEEQFLGKNSVIEGRNQKIILTQDGYETHTTDEAGQLLQKITRHTQKNNVVLEYYENGKVFKQYEYTYNKNGELIGENETRYQDGKPAFIMDCREGIWCHPDGKAVSLKELEAYQKSGNFLIIEDKEKQQSAYEAQEKAKSDKVSEVQAEEKGQPQAKSEQRSAGNEMGLKERLMVSEQEAFAQEPQAASPTKQSAHTLAEKRKEAREKGYYGKVPGGIDDVLAKAETEQNAHIISQTKDKMNS